MPFAQQRGQDVLADALAPKVIPAITARVRGSVQIHPVLVRSSGHPIPPIRDPLATQPEAALQTVQVDAARGVLVDLQFRHCSSSQSRLSRHKTFFGVCSEIYPLSVWKFNRNAVDVIGVTHRQ
jgi:hypothetical protein